MILGGCGIKILGFAQSGKKLLELCRMIKRANLETICQKIHPELFSFGLVMIPDDTYVSRSIDELFWLIFTHKQEQFLDLLDSHPVDSMTPSSSLRRNFMRELYTFVQREINAEKVGDDLEQTDMTSSYGPFYSLHLNERLALYCRTKVGLSWDEIAFVLDIPRYEAKVLVAQGREQMVRRIGLSFEKRYESKVAKDNSDESVYLYSEEYKQEYLNSFAPKKKCRFAKTAYNYVDSDEHEVEELSHFKLHMDTCDVCSSEIDFILNTFNEISKKIPFHSTPRERQFEFERNLVRILDKSVPQMGKGLRFFAPFVQKIREMATRD